jgi:hypothetical protein
MPTYNIVVFGGDYAGPEVSKFLRNQYQIRYPGHVHLLTEPQVTVEAVKVGSLSCCGSDLA